MNNKKKLIIEDSDADIEDDSTNIDSDVEDNNTNIDSNNNTNIEDLFSLLKISDNKNKNKKSVPLPTPSLPTHSLPTDFCNFNLKSEFANLNCDNENYYSPDCNKFLLKKEVVERKCIEEEPNSRPYLYPNLNDKDFNIKIASKKEFNDTKYDGTVHKNVKEYADSLSKVEFELQPHQAFVKNFMSSQTPYNSLLLYHMLGTGKTCSAIGVCEEMRDYMKQVGITKRILIVASENVQNNFKLQLFDERKLKLIDGVWNLKGCVGNKLLKEINPMNMRGISKEKVINQIKHLINTYYLFLGYGQFANYIIKTMNYSEIVQQVKEKEKRTKDKKGETNPQEKKVRSQIQIFKDAKVTLNKTVIRRLRNEFDNRLIVIDEVHNIRKADNAESKQTAMNLELLVKSAQNMRFLFLSATPMYNSYKEIIWLLNVMNMNDRRGRVDVTDVFDKNGDFKKNGEELLIRKATGYVSFVRGENPYTFPYRVYPNTFAKDHTFPHIKYPSYQMNLKKIKNKESGQILSLYLNKIGGCNNCGECQGCCYKYIIHNLRQKQFSITTKVGRVKEMPSFENMESFGYTLLQNPLESLIMSYPMEGLSNFLNKMPNEKYSEELSQDFSEQSLSKINDAEEALDEEPLDEEKEEKEVEEEDEEKEEVEEKVGGDDTSSEDGIILIDPSKLTGKQGLERMMDFTDSKNPPQKGNFKYKKSTVDKYGKIFSRETIGKYSSKISCVLEMILNSKTQHVSDGILLIYSQYIDAGLIPMALALEEMGFTRYGDKSKSLFKTKPTEPVDVRTMKPPTDKKDFMPAKYAIITGDTRLSPDNNYDLKGLTNENNKDGHKIKVVLISRAGSEGIDFKFIRQVHILDPWYNMNRIEQIIGRAVRNLSHKDLDFSKRNVEIFMHGTIIGEENKEEAADLYVYRVAEFKAIQIGKISRLLKETSVDCIINHDQTNFTQENMSKYIEEPIKQELSTGLVIDDLKIGDLPYSPACDYMSTCSYTCKPTKEINSDELNEDTYNENFIMMNSEKILQKIRMLMKESFFYKKDVLINAIQIPKKYPYVQIYAALTQLIDDNNEFIVDKYGRNGRLVNIGEYYLFQPIELNDTHVSIFDRSVPIDYKHEMIDFEINQAITKPVIDKRNVTKMALNENKKNLFENGKKIVDELNANLQLTKEFINSGKVPRGDDNWYKHCGVVMKKLSIEYPDIKEYLLSFLYAHMIEQLFYHDKIELLNYLYSLENISKDSIELQLKKYFESHVFTSKNVKCIILQDLNKTNLMKLDEENKWVIAEPEDQREIMSDKKVIDLLFFNPKDYNKYVGFIGYKKNNSVLVFKTKDITSDRDSGAMCEESGKSQSIKKLNLILGEDKYTNENTKMQKENGQIIQEATGQVELCILQEFILRYFNVIKKNDKKWFLTPEMAIVYKFYKIVV